MDIKIDDNVTIFKFVIRPGNINKNRVNSFVIDLYLKKTNVYECKNSFNSVVRTYSIHLVITVGFGSLV